MDLNHVNLRVRDPRACCDFYIEHFGFTPAFESDGGYFVRNSDGFLLALSPAEPHAALPGGFHIGFGLANADEVVAVHQRLESAGVPVAAISDFRPEEDFVSFRCWDPDDTEIEVFWETP